MHERSDHRKLAVPDSKDYEILTEKIVHESHDILNEIINYTLDTTNKENRFVPHDFKARVNEILSWSNYRNQQTANEEA